MLFTIARKCMIVSNKKIKILMYKEGFRLKGPYHSNSRQLKLQTMKGIQFYLDCGEMPLPETECKQKMGDTIFEN